MYTVEDVLKPEFRCSWHEAVAIVQEVASKIGGLPSVPPADALTLEEEGTVALGFASEIPENPVTSLACMLGRLLDGTGAPAELERVAREDAGRHPRHASLAEFTAALAFFERPDRRSQLRSLAQRICAARPSGADELERFRATSANLEAGIAPDEAVPEAQASIETATELERLRERIAATAAHLPLISNTKAGALRKALQTANRRQIVFASAALMAGAFGAFAVVHAVMSPTVVEPSTPTPVASAGAAKGASPGSVEALPATTMVPLTAEKPPVARERAARAPGQMKGPSHQTLLRQPSDLTIAAPRLASVRKHDRESVALEPVPPAFSDAVGRLGFSRAADQRDRPDSVVAAAAPRPDSAGERGVALRGGTARSIFPDNEGSHPELVSSRVYSAVESEVKPARLVRSQLPKEPAAGADTGYFDIVVDQSGDVELVKLISPAHRYEDRMLVAAAKAWKFKPALLRGEPVKYRLRIAIILQDAR